MWSVPNSPWAGELGGSTVAGGSAANPLKARWMGITNGVGIHGTGEDGRSGRALRTAASACTSGTSRICIRASPSGRVVLIR